MESRRRGPQRRPGAPPAETAAFLQERMMSNLAIAIKDKRWELAAYFIMVGIAQAAAKLPADTVSGLLAALEERPAGERKG